MNHFSFGKGISDAQDDANGSAKDQRFIVSRDTKQGTPLYLDEHGRPVESVADAHRHESEPIAGIMADFATQKQRPELPAWKVLPAPVETDPNDDGPVDQAAMNASYNRLARKAA